MEPKSLQVEITEHDANELLKTIELRLMQCGQNYQRSYQEDLHIAALLRISKALGVHFDLSDKGGHFKIEKHPYRKAPNDLLMN